MHLRWRSFRTRSQSSASRRAEATQRSAIEFARGLRGGVRRTSVPSAASTQSKAAANLASRSRIRKRGRRPRSVSSQVRLRACCVTQPESGLSVQAAKRMRRLSRRMKKSTQSRFRMAVSTEKRPRQRISQTGYDQPPSMLLFVLYACLRLLIDLALAPLRDRATDEAELLVLRHQVRVLERQVKVVRWRQADRLVLAALASRLPRPSWS